MNISRLSNHINIVLYDCFLIIFLFISFLSIFAYKKTENFMYIPYRNFFPINSEITITL